MIVLGIDFGAFHYHILGQMSLLFNRKQENTPPSVRLSVNKQMEKKFRHRRNLLDMQKRLKSTITCLLECAYGT